jgi:hypothetical protein
VARIVNLQKIKRPRSKEVLLNKTKTKNRIMLKNKKNKKNRKIEKQRVVKRFSYIYEVVQHFGIDNTPGLVSSYACSIKGKENFHYNTY